MKKITALTLAALLALSLSGCGSSSADSTAPQSDSGTSEENSSSSSEETTEATESDAGVAGVGDTLVDSENISITLVSVKTTKKGLLGSKPDNDYYVVAKFELVNNTEEEVTISSLLGFSLDGESGLGYDIAIFAETDGNLDGSIRPGRKMLGEVAFDAAKEELYYLVVKTSLFSDGVEFQISSKDL